MKKKKEGKAYRAVKRKVFEREEDKIRKPLTCELCGQFITYCKC